MGDVRGFLKVKREVAKYRPKEKRIKDYREVALRRSHKRSQEQASRCMECGTPFCHFGCPLANVIPEWNDLLFRGRWEEALEVLHSTNNFPEVTARVCPALCEFACVLGINDEPVTVRENELAIIEYGFEKGLIRPEPPKKRTGRKIAVIGSGPAGLAAAAQLNRAGHRVTLFEKDDRIGGILRYGIPDFKLEKWILDRRIRLLQKEGVIFKTQIEAGGDSLPVKRLEKEFDAICLSIGSREPRDLNVEGRELSGIHFAMDYLVQSNRRVAGDNIDTGAIIDAKGKRVVVIGGGDTGADCIGTAHRQGAVSVTQIEILPKPPESRTADMPWPQYPTLLKTTTSHEEGGIREWSVKTKRFVGEGGRVKKLICEKGEKEFELEADLVILAMGFIHPIHKGLLSELGIEFDFRGNVRTDEDYMTSVEGIFSAGDCHRGASLVVWAVAEGRKAARAIDKFLMGRSYLPPI